MRATCLILAGLFGLSTTANAALSARDWQSAGDGLLTFDDQSRLEWLDVTQTVNMSFNRVLGQLASGGTFEGFRVATSDQVRALFVSGGWTGSFNVHYNNAPGLHTEAVSIVSLLGETTASYDPYATYGMVSDTRPGGENFYNAMYAFDSPSIPHYASAWINAFATSPDNSFDHVGTYLYREVAAPIPEPETYALMLAGLGMLAIVHRRRRAGPASGMASILQEAT